MAEGEKVPEKKDIGARDIFRVFWSYARPQWVTVLVILALLASAQVMTSAFIPLLLKRFTDDLVQHTQVGMALIETLLGVVLLIAGLRLLSTFFTFITDYLTSKFETRIMGSLEIAALRHALGLSYQFFVDSFAGSLVKKIDRLSSSFQMLADLTFDDVWGLLVGSVATVIILARIEWTVAVVMLVWFFVTSLLNVWWIRRRGALDVERAKFDSESGALSADDFTNAINIKLFASERTEAKLFTKATDRLYEATDRTWILSAQANLMRGMLFVLLEFGTTALFVQGFSRGQLTIGDFVLFQAAIAALAARVGSVGRIIRMTNIAKANAKEAIELLQTVPSLVDVPGAKPLRAPQADIRFDHVSFSYGGADVLDDFSLDIADGERVAFVGSSGAGKTTITRLLLRFYDVQSGAILVNGKNIAQVTQESLRKAISLVPQEPILFHRSLRENIAYGRADASEKEIIAAAKKAHCHEFISALPKGYDTLVGERGIKLSGGERQRVAIARAILKDAPILILDEATSSLDSESESLIQDALRQLMKNKTVIVIAHRLSTIMQMDRIIVMEDGKVTDMGTHGELLKKVGTYQKLWHIQAGGFQQP